jgi:Tol biopolymer transport system component
MDFRLVWANGRQFASSETGYGNSGPRFSPDGREIAFASSTGGPYGELDIVSVDSGKVRQLTHDGALVLSPAWSADGRFIYFASSRGGTLNIWTIAESGRGSEQRPIYGSVFADDYRPFSRWRAVRPIPFLLVSLRTIPPR